MKIWLRDSVVTNTHQHFVSCHDLIWNCNTIPQFNWTLQFCELINLQYIFFEVLRLPLNTYISSTLCNIYVYVHVYNVHYGSMSHCLLNYIFAQNFLRMYTCMLTKYYACTNFNSYGFWINVLIHLHGCDMIRKFLLSIPNRCKILI
jgi:hypothetical protein